MTTEHKTKLGTIRLVTVPLYDDDPEQKEWDELFVLV